MDKYSPNRRLLEFEISQCRGELTGLSRTIDEVEGEIDRFHNPTHQESSQRSNQQPKNHDQAVSHYNKLMTKLHTLNCRAISHPIHRLPLELLELIFHSLLERDQTVLSPWHEEFPLNLTQVCSQWESLVLSVRNRHLWSAVRIDPADPDWLERLHLYLFLSRDEGLDIYITEMTQSIVDELAGHHRRIRILSTPGSEISQILDSATSEPDIIRVVITTVFEKRNFSIPLSSSVTALPFVDLEEGSLCRLQSFSQLQALQIYTQTRQLLELGGPLQLRNLHRLSLTTNENPLDFLRMFAPSQLLELRLVLQGSLSPAAYYELETFIIGHMPNLRWISLFVQGYIDSVFIQPLEESTTQSSSARQSESLRRIDCYILPSPREGIFPFERLIESVPHLNECHFLTSIKSLPHFSRQIRELEFNFHYSHISPVVDGEPFELVHLEVLRLAFATAEQLQLLALFQAPSLLSLRVSHNHAIDSPTHPIPVDAILTFISTSQGMHDLELKLGFPVDGMGLALPELRNLKVTYTSHILVLVNFDVPKLEHLFLKIDDGRGEGSIAGGEDLAEGPNGIASSPPYIEAVGSSNELNMVNTRQVLEIVEAQTANILEEDENEAEMNRFKGPDLCEAPSDPIMTRAPTFHALTFEHLKDFDFEVFTAFDSHLIRVLPYFPAILAAFPALEQITLPAVSFNDSPYIDQLVKKISEIPTLCPNLQEIRTHDYPNEWSNLLKFLRDRKRASMLSIPTLRPIHALHFPITPHGSIVEQLQDAMLGRVSTKAFPALYPPPLLIDSTLVHMAPSQRGDTEVGSVEEPRSRVQDGARVQIRGEGKGRKSEKESGYGKKEDEALSCFFCDKAGLGAGCSRVPSKRGRFSDMEHSNGAFLCSRWDKDPLRAREFEVICLP